MQKSCEFDLIEIKLFADSIPLNYALRARLCRDATPA
jgi:hypothetical protein